MSIILNLADLVNEKNQSSELWQAQRQADRENTNAMQDAGIVQITSDPDAYLRYLNCQADNPSYSAGNVALVMVQDQDATIFGTKDRWKSLMRSVSPTEEKNGVKIYTRSSFGKGYVLTDVYDVRQTSGRDLKHTALQPDSKEMTEALKTLLNYCVVPLVSDESIPMPALYDPNQMKMAVNPKYNDAEAFAGIATEIAHVRFHAKGYNKNYSRDDYELDAQSVGYMICRRFGVPCEAPDVSNLAAFYDGFDPQDRRQALGQIQDMAQKIGGSIERAIYPQTRTRNMNRTLQRKCGSQGEQTKAARWRGQLLCWGGLRARPEIRLTVRRIYDIGKEVSEHDKKAVLFCCAGPAAGRGRCPASVQAPRRADRSCLSGQ